MSDAAMKGPAPDSPASAFPHAPAPLPPGSSASPAAPFSDAPPRPVPGSVPVASPVLVRLALVLVAGVYVVAGAMKVGETRRFGNAIVDYHLVPEAVVPALAVLLPWWEIVAGLLALEGLWRRGALAVLTGLSAVFFAAGAVTLARGLHPSCGCFGALSGRVGPMSVLMDLSLLLLCGVLLAREMKNPV